MGPAAISLCFVVHAVCSTSGLASQDTLAGFGRLPQPFLSKGEVEPWNPDSGNTIAKQPALADVAEADGFQFPRGLQTPPGSWHSPSQSDFPAYGSHIGDQHFETPVSIAVPSLPMAASFSDNYVPSTQPSSFSMTTPPLIDMIQSSSVENDAGVSSFSNKDDSTQHASQRQESEGASPMRSVLCALLVSCGAIGSIITSAFLCNFACKAKRLQTELDPEEIKRRAAAAARLNSLLSGEPEDDSPLHQHSSRADSIEEGSVDGDGAGSMGTNFNASGYEPVRTNSAEPAINTADDECAE